MQFGLPEDFSDVVLFYNKKLFDDAGLAYPTSSWTWKDEAAAAAKLTDTSKGIYGDFQPVQFFEFYKTLAQSGGQFFNADKTKATFNSPEGVAAANWLLSKPGKFMPTLAQSSVADADKNLFMAGKLAMWHTGIWLFDALKTQPADWDIVVEPGNTNQTTEAFENAVVVSAKTKHPVESFEWLRYLTSSKLAVDTRLATSWALPPLADTSLFKPYLTVTPPANRAAVFDALKSTVFPPVIVRQQEMQDEVTKQLTLAADGKKSVQQALDDAAKTVDGLLK